MPPAGWQDEAGSLHLRLAVSLERLITNGELAPGAALPTERELARRASVSRATAALAYRQLKAAGHIDSRQGRGTWVTAPATGRRPTASGISPVLIHPDHAIDLSLAASEPSDELWAVLDDALGRAGGALAGVGYEPAGLPALRAALGGRTDEILVTTGAQQAIALVVDELVSPGDTVVVEDVTYVGALDAARRAGARLVAVPTVVDGVDVDVLVSAVERHAPALVYLNPTHQSPTGSVLPDGARARVVELSIRTGTPVVDDTSLASLGFDDGRRPRPLRSFDPGAPIVTVGSFSKTVWAGLRVGWLRAHPQLVERLVQRRMVADLGGSLVSQAVVLALFEQMPRLASARAAELAARHSHLCAALAAAIPRSGPLPLRRVAPTPGSVCRAPRPWGSRRSPPTMGSTWWPVRRCHRTAGPPTTCASRSVLRSRCSTRRSGASRRRGPSTSRNLGGSWCEAPEAIAVVPPIVRVLVDDARRAGSGCRAGVEQVGAAPRGGHRRERRPPWAGRGDPRGIGRAQR
ncbi:MAG: PLP-dependent aminotransferase family protein [Acidimicrobiia bacterium]|nr:PLP-dependent aminotransferase family protein [Acidimicrobiia bacterium]